MTEILVSDRDISEWQRYKWVTEIFLSDRDKKGNYDTMVTEIILCDRDLWKWYAKQQKHCNRDIS